jgi:nicotinate phosphoribosyltransferase
MVYKLVAREGGDGTLVPVAKASTRKPSTGGRKTAARRLDDEGRASEEVVVTGPDQSVATWAPAETGLRPLHVPLVAEGAIDTRWTGSGGVQRATERHHTSRAELPRGARRLSTGDPALPTVTLTLD